MGTRGHRGKMEQRITHQRDDERRRDDSAYAPAASRMSLHFSHLLAAFWRDEVRRRERGVRLLIRCEARREARREARCEARCEARREARCA